LQGHIALATLVVPEGTLGSRFDSVARLALWQLGLDYNHGTGHGVGSFLNVHEGPQGIGFRKRDNEVVRGWCSCALTGMCAPRMSVRGPTSRSELRPVVITCDMFIPVTLLLRIVVQGFHAGMTVSNEPGYYEDGNFGIRIENLCITEVRETEHNFLGNRYVGFDTVTMSPIATNLIQLNKLTDGELAWLNDYHAQVRALLMPYMKETFPEAVAYLTERTEPVTNK
jgi:Xaa-Pro aminopeptidase